MLFLWNMLLGEGKMEKKYKVAVYAISKNEEKFVDRWYNSMKEADKIYVLDTGSSDKTVELLQERGVLVKRLVIDPWRFDVARNEALKMVDEDIDICVSTDLDEVFLPGWREKLDNIWNDKMTRVRYTYNWRLENEKPLVSFLYDKIHSRDNYKWIYPVHEVLKCSSEEVYGIDEEIILNHYPDVSKSRGGYLKLLELSVKENPIDDRNWHYLGREYMYQKRWEECIETLKKHLLLENATWLDERAASMRYIGRSYFNLGKMDEAREWYMRAINEAPYLRDGYVEMAIFSYHMEDYLAVINNLILAKTIKEHEKTYINEIFSWDYTIDNLLSVSFYNLGLYEEALFFIDKAIKFDKNNQMLQDNREIIYRVMNMNI